MGETQIFFLRLGIALLGAVLIGGACSLLARKKGRDTIGWGLNGFFPGLVGFFILVFAFPGSTGWILCGLVVSLAGPFILFAFPSIETPGQTKTCAACGRIAGWKASSCPGCDASLQRTERDKTLKVRRPLRTFYLYLFLVILVLLIVFGFIGYYSVPDQPQIISLSGNRPVTGIPG